MGLITRKFTPSAGKATIVVRAPAKNVAPASYGLSLDMTGTTFDTPIAGTIFEHDHQYHLFDFYWNYDDPGVYVHPLRVIDTWKDRNYGRGMEVDVMYRAGGSYGPNCIIVEKSSGKVAFADVVAPIVVEGQDSGFSGDNTILVNPVGDSDFSWYSETTANQFNANELTNAGAAWAAARAVSGDARIMLKPGADYPGNTYLRFNSADAKHITIMGDPTDANPPTLHSGAATHPQNTFFYLANDMGFSGQVDIRVSCVILEGPHDPVTNPESFGGLGLWMDHDCYVMWDRVRTRGSQVISHPNNTNHALNVHMDGTFETNWGGWNNDGGSVATFQYPIFFGESANRANSFARTGCVGRQASNGVSGSNDERAFIRINNLHRTYLAKNEDSHRDYNQPVWKLLETAQMDWCRINAHDNSLEQGLQIIALGHNWTQSFTSEGQGGRSAHTNTRIENTIMVGGFNTQSFMQIRHAGVTIINALCIQPDMPAFFNRLSQFFQISLAGTPSAAVAAQPIRIVQPTCVNRRTSGNNLGTIPPVVGGTGGFTDVSVENGLLHMPQIGVTVPGLDETTDLWQSDHTFGHIDWDSQVANAAYATPAGSIKSYRPIAAGAQDGAVIAGEVAYRDLYGTVRPSPPSPGYAEASV